MNLIKAFKKNIWYLNVKNAKFRVSGCGLGNLSNKFLSTFFPLSTDHSNPMAPSAFRIGPWNVLLGPPLFLFLLSTLSVIERLRPHAWTRVKSSRKPGEHREWFSWEPAGLIQQWQSELMRSECPRESERRYPLSTHTGCTYKDISENVVYTFLLTLTAVFTQSTPSLGQTFWICLDMCKGSHHGLLH